MALPENLAPKATITADSEYSADYRATFVANGKIAEECSRSDLGMAWAVNGQTHKAGASLTFRWEAPVEVREVLYFGRTGWFLEESWSSCEVFCDDEVAPVASVALAAAHGPQRITLPAARTVGRLRLAFKNGGDRGPNPGASEIMVFASPASEQDLARFTNAYASEVSGSEASRQAQARLKAGELGFGKIEIGRAHV